MLACFPALTSHNCSRAETPGYYGKGASSATTRLSTPVRFGPNQQLQELFLISNDCRITACTARANSSATATTTNRMCAIATNTRVAATSTAADNSISTWAPYSSAIIAFDVCMTTASAANLPRHLTKPQDRSDGTRPSSSRADAQAMGCRIPAGHR